MFALYAISSVVAIVPKELLNITRLEGLVEVTY